MLPCLHREHPIQFGVLLSLCELRITAKIAKGHKRSCGGRRQQQNRIMRPFPVSNICILIHTQLVIMQITLGVVVGQPVNCQVSGWTDFSACSKTCGYGKQSRKRVVIMSGTGGKKCPSLVDTRDCRIHECGKWKTLTDIVSFLKHFFGH